MRRSIILILSALALTLVFGVNFVSAQGDQQVVHVVSPGENLFRISLRYGVPLAEIARINNISNVNLIYAGQRLVISGAGPAPVTPTPPPGDGDGGTTTTYTVVRGDTLGSIARRFGTTVQAIATANGIVNVNLIFPGQVLTIPAGGSVPTPPVATPPPGGNPNPNPLPNTGFELGGHVDSFAYPDQMRGAGMTWVKRQIRYNQGDPASIAQGAINQANANGFNILLGVVGNPAQLAAGGQSYIQDFANFLAGVAALGPDGIEVWNEPNIDREWPTGQISGGNYTNLLRAAYQAVKGVNQNILVVSGAPAPTGAESAFPGAVVNDDNFLRQMAGAGAASFMDCLGIHYNEGILPPTATSGDPRGNSGFYSRYYPAMVSLYSSIFPNTPLCFTELGYLTGEGYGPLPGNFNWAANTTAQEQAEWLAQAATLSRNNSRIRMMIVWNVDFTNYGADPAAGYAIIRPDGSCRACVTLGAAMQ